VVFFNSVIDNLTIQAQAMFGVRVNATPLRVGCQIGFAQIISFAYSGLYLPHRTWAMVLWVNPLLAMERCFFDFPAFLHRHCVVLWFFSIFLFYSVFSWFFSGFSFRFLFFCFLSST
jgi:hypothetical protein